MTAKKSSKPGQKRFQQFDKSDVYSLHDDEPIIFKEYSTSSEQDGDDEYDECDDEGFGFPEVEGEKDSTTNNNNNNNSGSTKKSGGESIWVKTRNAMQRYNSQRRKGFEVEKLEEAAQYDYSQAYQSGK